MRLDRYTLTSMTRVLIAVDHSEESSAAAERAHALFGDDASYLIVNVMEHSDGVAGAWGHVYPVATPFGTFPLLSRRAVAAVDQPSTEEEAAETAEEVAVESDLDGAETIGAAGDPVVAILAAAHEHDVDVIVIGSHQRNWFGRLFDPSMASQILKKADVPVLVVK